jgi:hypothetical protein
MSMYVLSANVSDSIDFGSLSIGRILSEPFGMNTLLDLEDGHLDGRKPPTPLKPCPKCGRMLSRERPSCLY